MRSVAREGVLTEEIVEDTGESNVGIMLDGRAMRILLEEDEVATYIIMASLYFPIVMLELARHVTSGLDILDDAKLLVLPHPKEYHHTVLEENGLHEILLVRRGNASC